MKHLTLTESFRHINYTIRATTVICWAGVMAFLIEYWVSDREVEP